MGFSDDIKLTIQPGNVLRVDNGSILEKEFSLEIDNILNPYNEVKIGDIVSLISKLDGEIVYKSTEPLSLEFEVEEMESLGAKIFRKEIAEEKFQNFGIEVDF